MTNELGNLIRLYVGHGKIFPKMDLEPVFANTDQCNRNDVTALLEKIVAELKEIQPDWQSRDLMQNSRYAADSIYRRYPDMGELGRDTLEWLYSWWWK